MHVDELATPLATSRRWEKFLTKESFVRIASQFMDSNINCATTAIKDHNHAIFDHLCFKRGLAILAALNTGTLWLQTQKQVA